MYLKEIYSASPTKSPPRGRAWALGIVGAWTESAGALAGTIGRDVGRLHPRPRLHPPAPLAPPHLAPLKRYPAIAPAVAEEEADDGGRDHRAGLFAGRELPCCRTILEGGQQSL